MRTLQIWSSEHADLKPTIASIQVIPDSLVPNSRVTKTYLAACDIIVDAMLAWGVRRDALNLVRGDNNTVTRAMELALDRKWQGIDQQSVERGHVAIHPDPFTQNDVSSAVLTEEERRRGANFFFEIIRQQRQEVTMSMSNYKECVDAALEPFEINVSLHTDPLVSSGSFSISWSGSKPMVRVGNNLVKLTWGRGSRSADIMKSLAVLQRIGYVSEATWRTPSKTLALRFSGIGVYGLFNLVLEGFQGSFRLRDSAPYRHEGMDLAKFVQDNLLTLIGDDGDDDNSEITSYISGRGQLKHCMDKFVIGENGSPFLHTLYTRDHKENFLDTGRECGFKDVESPLKSHQVLAAIHMQALEKGVWRGGILAEEMGMGKTASVLLLVCAHRDYPKQARPNEGWNPIGWSSVFDHSLSRERQVAGSKTVIFAERTTLYVTKDALVSQVIREAEKWTNLRVAKWVDISKKYLSKIWDYDLIIISYKQLSANSGKLLRSTRFLRCVYDEFQDTTKNQSSSCSHFSAMYTWFVSGTPFASPELLPIMGFMLRHPWQEMFVEDEASHSNVRAQIQALQPITIRQFHRRSLDEGKLQAIGIRATIMVPLDILRFRPGDKNSNYLSDNITNFCQETITLSRTTVNAEIALMSVKQKKQYERITEDWKGVDNRLHFNKVRDLIRKLLHSSLCAPDVPSFEGFPQKLQQLSNILTAIRENGEKALVYLSEFSFIDPESLQTITFNCSTLKKLLECLGINTVTATSHILQFAPDAQPSESDCGILLLDLKRSSSGLNLQNANHIIFLAPYIESAMCDQAIGRVLRMGQIRNVFIWYLVSDAPIEQGCLLRVLTDLTNDDDLAKNQEEAEVESKIDESTEEIESGENSQSDEEMESCAGSQSDEEMESDATSETASSQSSESDSEEAVDDSHLKAVPETYKDVLDLNAAKLNWWRNEFGEQVSQFHVENFGKYCREQGYWIVKDASVPRSDGLANATHAKGKWKDGVLQFGGYELHRGEVQYHHYKKNRGEVPFVVRRGKPSVNLKKAQEAFALAERGGQVISHADLTSGRMDQSVYELQNPAVHPVRPAVPERQLENQTDDRWWTDIIRTRLGGGKQPAKDIQIFNSENFRPACINYRAPTSNEQNTEYATIQNWVGQIESNLKKVFAHGVVFPYVGATDDYRRRARQWKDSSYDFMAVLAEITGDRCFEHAGFLETETIKNVALQLFINRQPTHNMNKFRTDEERIQNRVVAAPGLRSGSKKYYIYLLFNLRGPAAE